MAAKRWRTVARYPGFNSYGLAWAGTLGWFVWGHEGLHEEGIEASRRALDLEPGNARFVNDLGWSLLESGRVSEAQETLSRAVAMDPDDELARENLRFCVAKLATGPGNSGIPNQAPQPSSRARRSAKSRKSSPTARD